MLSHVQLFVTPWTVAWQALLSMEFSRQEYWSVLPLHSPGDLPNPGIEPGSPILRADSLSSESPGGSFLLRLTFVWAEKWLILWKTKDWSGNARFFVILDAWKEDEVLTGSRIPYHSSPHPPLRPSCPPRLLGPPVPCWFFSFPRAASSLRECLPPWVFPHLYSLRAHATFWLLSVFFIRMFSPFPL